MDELLAIGSIGKAHGLKGEVVVRLISNVPDRLAPGEVFSTDHGELVVRATRPHQGNHLVYFEGIGDRPAAESLRGLVLRADRVEETPDGFWVHELIGSTVRELDGTERGTVTAVEANPASDLLVLDSGALVPVDFVVSSGEGVVEIDPPAGLFEL